MIAAFCFGKIRRHWITKKQTVTIFNSMCSDSDYSQRFLVCLQKGVSITNNIWRTIVYWAEALTLLLIWYWLFKENSIVRISIGILGIILAITCYFKPEWQPNRGTLLINKLPEKVQYTIRRYSCLVTLVASIYILAGYRLESYRTLGLAVLALFTPLFFIYLFALLRHKAEDIPRGLTIFFLCTLIVFLCFTAIFITTRGEEKVRMFEEMSPWPMIVVFFILYAIQAVVIRRRRSRRTA